MPPFPPPHFPGEAFINSDLISSLIIVVASFFIYFWTKELYQLSGHKGIKYFRYAFLFFGLSFLMQFARPILEWFTELSRSEIRTTVTFLIVYTGSMAVLCLLYSVLWKKLKKYANHDFLVVNVCAVVLASSTMLGRYHFLILLLQMMLFILAIVLGYVDSKKKKSRVIELYLLYLLLFCSWLANIVAKFVVHLSFSMGVLLNIVSALLFLVLMYKVVKRTRVKQK